MTSWCRQTASCSTSYGCCNSWAWRSSWRQWTLTTSSTHGAALLSALRRRAWKPPWRSSRAGWPNCVSKIIEDREGCFSFILKLWSDLTVMLLAVWFCAMCFIYSSFLCSHGQMKTPTSSQNPSSPPNVSSWRCTPTIYPSCLAAGVTSAGCEPSANWTGIYSFCGTAHVLINIPCKSGM